MSMSLYVVGGALTAGGGMAIAAVSCVSDAISRTVEKAIEFLKPPFPPLSEENLSKESILRKGTSLFNRSMTPEVRTRVAKQALKALRERGGLLTESEFYAQTAPAWYARFFRQYVCKRASAIDRVFGREVIAQAARDLNIQNLIRVPRKYALIRPRAPWIPGRSVFAQSTDYDPTNPNLTIYRENYFRSDDIDVLAERINPIDRFANRDEMEAILAVIQRTGFSDVLGNNIMVGENQRGEEGIYFIDTEHDSFNGIAHLSELSALMAPEDEEWLEERLAQLRAARNHQPSGEDLGPQIDREPFTVPIAEVI